MSAKTIKLPDELEDRISSVIDGTGKTMHAYLLEAVEQQTQLAERRRKFVADALASREEWRRTGIGYAAEEVHAYAKARAAGKKASRPKARTWRK